jgi:hydroxymethylpyrimidine/phosphomethylpyrimidine kinase
LVRVNQDPVWWHGDRIETANTHGTGCTLSSAIATFMAQGVDLVTAVGNARDVIRQALRAGAGVTTGRGSGPLNHFAAPVAMQINTINK